MKRKSVPFTLLLFLLFTFSLAGVCRGVTLSPSITIKPDLANIPLAAPSELTAAAVSSSEIELSWQDNNAGDSRFQVERKTEEGAFVIIGSTLEGVTTFSDSGLDSGTTFYYRVKSYTRSSQSVYSNEAVAKTSSGLGLNTQKPLIPDLIINSPPAAPSGLQAIAVSATQIDLSWEDQSSDESGFRVERRIEGGDFALLAEVGADIVSLEDTSGLAESTTYYYRVKAFNAAGESQYSPEASAVAESEYTKEATTYPGLGSQNQIIIEYVVGSTDYTVNGQAKAMDVPPVIVEGRVFLPLRYVIEPLGAVLDWDDGEQKITIVLDGNTIELWVGQNTAAVNGAQQSIDPDNPNVAPFIMPPGRVMVPVRFVSQNLGCSVTWDAALQKITVTYNQPQ